MDAPGGGRDGPRKAPPNPGAAHNSSSGSLTIPQAGQQVGDSIILEEEIDPSYEPTEAETVEYAKWLGMDIDEDK